MTSLKFHNASLQLLGLLFLSNNAAVKDIVGTNLLMKFFGYLRRGKILGVSHLTKELLAPAGKFYPVGFEAPAKPCDEVFFHTTKIGKRNDSTKFNKLCINGLKAIYGLSDGLDTLFSEGQAKISKVLYGHLIGSNRLIFNGLKTNYTI